MRLLAWHIERFTLPHVTEASGANEHGTCRKPGDI
jgi:hypothetical protein